MRRRVTFPFLLTGLALGLTWLGLGGTLAAQQRSRIYGTVSDEDGNPLAGASVKAENPINMPSLLTATTDKKGKFAFGGVNVGDWKLSVTADGYHGYEELFQVGINQNVRKQIVLKRATGAALLATSQKARAEVEEARKLFESGNYDGAIRVYQQLLSKAPEVYQIHYNMALALERKADYAGAVEEYRLFLQKEPDHFEANLNLATALTRSGKPKEAIPYYEKCASLDPKNAISFFNLGLVFFQTEEMDRALEAFRRAVAMDPQLADAHFMLGNVYLRKEDPAAARGSYEKFLELAPDSPNAAAARQAIEQLKN